MGPVSPADDESDPLAPHSLSPGELKELLGTERAGEPFLVLRDGEGKLLLHVARGGDGTLTIGRHPEADVAIGWDPEVSGLHAELNRAGGEWSVVDDGLSTNGTYVNGRRIAGRQRLRDGDRLRVGGTTLVYRTGGRSPVEETVSAGDGPPALRLTDAQRRVLLALCRPYRNGGEFTRPATNQQIAEEVFLSVDAVKMHLRALYGKFELAELAQNEKRTRLAECALQFGVISPRELEAGQA
jgi:pSer/pThr/pTyr-binding forkhead associated (FHA) protein